MKSSSIYQVIREGLFDEVPSEQRHEGKERKSHGRREFPEEEGVSAFSSQCKGCEAGVCMMFSRNSKETSMTGGKCIGRGL